MAYVCRDPFARTELHKSFVPTDRTCDWCGQMKSVRGQKGLYRFRTESDGGRSFEHRGLFCTKSCHDSYHD